MLKLCKVAVTGGLSSGKTTACRFFKEFGAYVVSADEIVHQLLSPNTIIGQKVIHLIGADIVVDHHIDRSKIANKVFNQPTLLNELEKILHPAVQKEIEKQYQEVDKSKTAPLFVAEVPLLFETGSDRFFDYTVTVVADSETCRQRFQQSKKCNHSEYDKRSARQLPIDDKAKRADFVIKNNGTLEYLKNEVKRIYINIIT